ncbi:MAG: class II histone deacetylase [Halobacteriales archaeon]
MATTPAAVRAFWHKRTLDHVVPAGTFKVRAEEFFAAEEPHPDRPERIENLRRMLELAIEDVDWSSSDPASITALEQAHDPEYVEWFREFCADGGGFVGETTTGAGPASFDAARRSAGLAVAATMATIDHPDGGVPYALCRPSGHHAQPDRADGFCFFNNAAVASEAALERDGIDSVAILDWDVHHGNGTQACFYNRSDVLYISLHNDHGAWHEYYHPQTGGLEETGDGDGVGYNVNIPLPPGTGNEGYRHVLDRLVEPILSEFGPDLIVVSAGQDPGISDPLGRNTVTRPGFEAMGDAVRRYAERLAEGRLAVIQEGGYQLTHLPIATLGVFEGLLDRSIDISRYGIEGDPFTMYDEYSPAVDSWTREAIAAHSQHWSLTK